MNGDLRKQLDTEPVPFAGAPARACVVIAGSAWQVAWLVGTVKQPTGITFDRARDACAAAIYLNERNGQ